ncbi:MAG: Rpn family recombination-promoting nuclease/putative transposase [Lachnospiraceae bacterium]|nr:Rpn family recombination-promoting nuclease/putative transposase [Lachnospiraceae bacterium]
MQTSTERLALIQQMDLMDDVFFQKVVEDKTVCEEILRVLLQAPDLKVIEAQTQRFLRNIGAHSVILDLICQDGDGAQINVEVQKSDEDDHVKRARFNISNIDTTFTEKGLYYKDLPDIYVVFLTRSDIFKEGKTVYHLGMSIKETGTLVDDGVYRIFANCAVDDGSDIAGLMQYFKTTKGANSKFPRLSKRVRYFKESQEGADNMSDVVEKYFQERIAAEMAEHDKETAKTFLRNGASVGLVQRSIPTLSADDIEELNEQLMLAEK